jgi:pyridoxamine 5'-phosphate oxidase
VERERGSSRRPTPDELDPSTVDADPLVQFRAWYGDAWAAGVRQPDAMTLATVDTAGEPDSRTVLLRGLDERGFVFYTNVESAKARQLVAHPRAALVFHWRELERQVRAIGTVDRVSIEEATAYWNSRPREHRISAWASPQSDVVDADTLTARLVEIEARFREKEPPLPQFWGGYRVAIDTLELWQGRQHRLHDRVRYRRDAGGLWIRERLAP